MAKDVRQAAEAEPGPADISVKNMGGEGGAQRRLPRLIEVS